MTTPEIRPGPNDPLIRRGTTRTTIGVEVDTLSVDLLVNSDVTVGNVPIATFARNGGFDGARMVLDRYFSASWQSEACGSLNLFGGRVADVEITGGAIHLEVKSDLELLNVMMPRNLYSATCVHSLYDDGCGLVAADFTVAGTIGANSTTQALYCNLAQADGYFGLGTLQFLDGPNAGVRRTVKRYVTGLVVPVPPLPETPLVGDSFEIKPGCDKLMATCNSAKFDNLGNFRAFPFVPNAETAY